MRTSCRKTLGERRAIEQELEVIETRIRMLTDAAAAAEKFCRRTAGVDGPTFARLKEMFALWARAELRLHKAQQAKSKLEVSL